MHSIKLKHYLLVFLCELGSVCAEQVEGLRGPPFYLISPDGAVQTVLALEDDGRLVYAAAFHDQRVVYPSPLGITLDGCDGGQVSELSLLRTREEQARYPNCGVSATAELHARRALYYVKPRSGAAYGLQLVVANEGFAWRFLLPIGRGVRRVNAENAVWRLPPESRLWREEAGQWRSAMLNAPATEAEPAQAWPVIVELPQPGYAVITEALSGAYGVMRLTTEPQGVLRGRLTEPQGFDVEGAVQTPWRVVMLADDLEGLVNNALVGYLAAPPDPDLFDASAWLMGGRSVWSAVDQASVASAGVYERQLIDQAKALNFEFITIEAGWSAWPRAWETLSEVCAYAHTQNIRVLVGVEVQKIEQAESDFANLRGLLDQVQQAGADGVKIIAAGDGSRAARVFELRFLHEAARRKLLVNAHGFQAPAGESRTYANEVTRGQVQTNQQVAANNAALPFTRCVVGHTDYMPFDFDGPTTWTHQLAMAYLVTSPLLVMRASPQRLLSDPALAVALPWVQTMPVGWDETRVLLGSRIGELAAMARRKGAVWYIAMVNGTDGLKLASCALNFTGWQRMRVTQLADVRDNAATLAYSEKQLKDDAILIVSLEPRGGFLARVQQE